MEQDADMMFMPLVREDLLCRDLDDEAIIYDATKSKVHALNATARLIWNGCDGKHTVEDLAEELCRRFEVDQDTAIRDTRRAIEEFRALGLLAEPQEDRGDAPV